MGDYSPQEVPETRLGDDLVGREDAHTVDFWSGLRLSGEMATDDLVFLERHLDNSQSGVHPTWPGSIQPIARQLGTFQRSG